MWEPVFCFSRGRGGGATAIWFADVRTAWSCLSGLDNQGRGLPDKGRRLSDKGRGLASFDSRPTATRSPRNLMWNSWKSYLHNYHSLFSFFKYYFYQVFHSSGCFTVPDGQLLVLAIRDNRVRLCVEIRVSFVMCLEFAIKRVHLTFYGQN